MHKFSNALFIIISGMTYYEASPMHKYSYSWRYFMPFYRQEKAKGDLLAQVS